MGFWAWFCIWTTLGIAALSVLGLIAKSLFNRAMDVLHQINRLEPKVSNLLSATQRKGTAKKPANSIDQDPRLARAAWSKLLVAKAKNRQARQRRLIASLKAFKPEESRFH